MPFAIRTETQLSDAAETCAALVSTILFHRCFGTLRPGTGEVHGVAYPIPASGDAEALITQARKDVSKLCLNAALPLRVCVAVDFAERKPRRNSWFGRQDAAWESWRVELVVVKSADRAAEAAALRAALTQVVLSADGNKREVPPITSTDVMPFPATVAVTLASV